MAKRALRTQKPCRFIVGSQAKKCMPPSFKNQQAAVQMYSYDLSAYREHVQNYYLPINQMVIYC